MSVLTADLCARAIVAAARSYGDDPIKAVGCRRGPNRRALIAAAVAVRSVMDLSAEAAARVFSVYPDSLRRAKVTATLGFKQAVAAAEGAVLGWIEPVEAPAPERAAEAAAALPPPAAAKASRTPRVLTAKAAQREVLGVLQRCPATGPELMGALNLAEPCVREALRALSAERLIAGDALTAEGWRVQFWRKTGG